MAPPLCAPEALVRAVSHDTLPSTALREAVAAGVRQSIRQHFPHNFYSLCHAYAVVGSNLASIATGREYRPVAGLAAIDVGNGQIIAMDEDHAFGATKGGAYHCWIESAHGGDRELVDLTFGHNHHYAIANGYAWHGGPPPLYLWGPYSALTVNMQRKQLAQGFGQDRIWLQETTAGALWLDSHVAGNANAYVHLTTQALCHYRSLHDNDTATAAEELAQH